MSTLNVFVGFANIKRTLAKSQTVADVNRMWALSRPSPFAVVAFCEIEQNSWHHDAVAALSGGSVYWPAGAAKDTAAPNAVAMVAKNGLQRTAFGSQQLNKGKAKVTPNRFANWQVLHEPNSQVGFWHIATQFISGGYTKKPDGTMKYANYQFRQKDWILDETDLVSLVKTLLAQHGPNGVITGDFNRNKWEDPAIKGLGGTYHWTKTGTHGKGVWYDYFITFGAAHVDPIQSINLNSDHQGLTSMVRFGTPDPTPAPPPAHVPTRGPNFDSLLAAAEAARLGNPGSSDADVIARTVASIVEAVVETLVQEN